MISTILAENAVLARVLLGVAIAGCAAVGALLFRAGRTRALLVLAAVGLLGGLALTLSPSDDGAATEFCTMRSSLPFPGLDGLANAAMLLPLTLFAGLAVRRPLAVLAAVSGLSALIELVQALVPALQRSCDTDDWIMNTAGAVVGALLALGIIALGRRRHPAS